jgi:regulation of enolase protein 1 (concanavalin A-like superfamily)
VYFGMDAQVVKNATKTAAEYKGSKALGDESYSPGKLAWYTTYYWRVDEVNAVHPDSPWVGNLWSFTTGDFLLIDDFESYDTGDNQIWYAWHDGLGYGAPGTPPYFAGNGTGAAVGDETTASFTEETIVHGGRKAMPLSYDNNKQGFAKYSEAEFKLTAPRDWTEESVGELSIWFRGLPGSVGSFVEAPAGTYTMTASGTDIWDVGAAGNYRDEFHFAYKTLTGAGSIVAKVQSVQNTNAWSKAGVMIRETLDAGSKHAFACVTPSNGVGSQGRDTTGGASFNTNQTGLTAPYWVKLERDAAGNFTVTHSANGTAWSPVTGATPRNIPMATTVYVGLALTSHDAALTCQAVFTNVTTTGTVSPQWAHQDIGIGSNAAEPLYVAVSNAAGQPAVVVHPDPKAAQITTWTEWVVPLQSLTGITLTNVDRIAVGLGTRGNMTTAGGSGKMYFDDIRLYRPRTAP